MANELLDFVLALARDPDAAARYAADPAQALADAHLTGVTSADVNNLLPMVSDSLSMAAPQFGGEAGGTDVWTSGAATAAFDAFTPHTAPAPDRSSSVIDAGPAVHDTPISAEDGVSAQVSDVNSAQPVHGGDDAPSFDPVEHGGAVHPVVWGAWEHDGGHHPPHDAAHPGFDHLT